MGSGPLDGGLGTQDLGDHLPFDSSGTSVHPTYPTHVIHVWLTRVRTNRNQSPATECTSLPTPLMGAPPRNKHR